MRTMLIQSLFLQNQNLDSLPKIINWQRGERFDKKQNIQVDDLSCFFIDRYYWFIALANINFSF
ncbi:hypothetical protein ACA29_20915 [Lederbergia galactosidilytica]|uniref:Uncharacterized protein n=1 Tax=Lederbergia galactosidilytica TaxID=217031 RepID=A0A0Q9Y2E9_9BACI|nr:hypothetical protein ACA29_20915 [Lederbergia galactosidilytica]